MAFKEKKFTVVYKDGKYYGLAKGGIKVIAIRFDYHYADPAYALTVQNFKFLDKNDIEIPVTDIAQINDMKMSCKVGGSNCTIEALTYRIGNVTVQYREVPVKDTHISSLFNNKENKTDVGQYPPGDGTCFNAINSEFGGFFGIIIKFDHPVVSLSKLHYRHFYYYAQYGKGYAPYTTSVLVNYEPVPRVRLTGIDATSASQIGLTHNLYADNTEAMELLDSKHLRRKLTIEFSSTNTTASYKMLLAKVNLCANKQFLPQELASDNNGNNISDNFLINGVRTKVTLTSKSGTTPTVSNNQKLNHVISVRQDGEFTWSCRTQGGSATYYEYNGTPKTDLYYINYTGQNIGNEPRLVFEFEKPIYIDSVYLGTSNYGLKPVDGITIYDENDKIIYKEAGLTYKDSATADEICFRKNPNGWSIYNLPAYYIYCPLNNDLQI